MVIINYSDPSAPPGNIQATYTTSTSLTLMWYPPPFVDQNGHITFYSLTLRDLLFNTNDITAQSPTNSYTFTSLNEYNNYSCEIAAATSVGLGPYSQLVMFTTSQDG